MKTMTRSDRFSAGKFFSVLLAAVLLLSIGAEAFAEIQIDAQVMPDSGSPARAVIFLGNNDLWVTLADGRTYLISFSDIPGIASGFIGTDIPGSLDGIHMDVDEATLMRLAERYGKILLKAVSLFNTSRKKMAYPLTALGVSPECSVITCTPSARNWKKMLKSLFETASKDEDLAAILPRETLSYFAALAKNVDPIAAVLEDTSAQIAYDSGSLYAVRLSNKNNAVCYQSYGGFSSGQQDAVLLEKDGISTVLARAVTTVVNAQIPADAISLRSSDEVLSVLNMLAPSLFSAK